MHTFYTNNNKILILGTPQNLGRWVGKRCVKTAEQVNNPLLHVTRNCLANVPPTSQLSMAAGKNIHMEKLIYGRIHSNGLALSVEVTIFNLTL